MKGKQYCVKIYNNINININININLYCKTLIVSILHEDNTKYQLNDP
jgi:hypothetical protein